MKIITMYRKGYWKVKKILYGFKQASREWNENKSNTLKKLSFERLNNYTMYICF